VTDPAASYDAWIRLLRPALLGLAMLALAACGSQKSTLPPAPAGSGQVALHDLAHFPEVYSDAQVTTVGTVARVHAGRQTVYVLRGGGGTRIVLLPAASAAGELGRRVRVSGLFSVSFQYGYEITITRIRPAASL
jgi:hypothetical protein